MTGVLIKRENWETHMYTGSAPCKQTKEMGLKQILPSLLSEGTNPVDTLTLDFQSPESGDDILLLFKSLDLHFFFFFTATAVN